MKLLVHFMAPLILSLSISLAHPYNLEKALITSFFGLLCFH